MKLIQRYILLFLMAALPLLLTAQTPEAAAKVLTIDQKIDQAFRPVADQISNVVFYSIPLGGETAMSLPAAELVAAPFTQLKFKSGTDCDKLEKVSQSAYAVTKFTPTESGKYKIGAPATQTNIYKGAFDENNACANVVAADTATITVFLKANTAYTIISTGISDSIAAVPALSVALLPTQMPIVLLVLLLGALFCTIYFGFPNFTKIGLSIRAVSGKYTVKKNGGPVEAGEVSHFQALTTALSATVGLGNIAGVAIALSIGGPGATFWMVVAGFLGMASKFAECTLGVKYREIDASGTVHGGPMYYMRTGFAERGMGKIGKFFAGFFALMCVGGSFGGGNMFQSNQAAQQVVATFGGGASGGPTSGGFIFGLICAALVAVIIVGGVQRIAQVTDKLVPFMAVLYVGMGVVILVIKYDYIPAALDLIFSRAFAPQAIGGGVIGAMIAGFQRAAFSNEAGVGSAAIAHSAVKTQYPASEGIVALLEPFIDTVIICSMSALVIVVTNMDGNFLEYGTKAGDGVGITSTAFDSVIPGASYILTVVIVLFAFSTMISWSYYGLQAWKYLFGKSKFSDISYKIIFCCFTVIGASASLGAVIDFSDAMIFAMVFPNMIALVVLAPVIKAELTKYISHTQTIEKESSSK
jgi:AGCS family alanine or glycine:cation symporter